MLERTKERSYFGGHNCKKMSCLVLGEDAADTRLRWTHTNRASRTVLLRLVEMKTRGGEERSWLKLWAWNLLVFGGRTRWSTKERASLVVDQ
ncbi:hypothetical protein ACJRO7_000201 [Eucalyptus globulus]|uniref:Uncharacterized protein n=1 Tax=Eucalyptus globulus TaxID=34317 RepID=A0ABD3LQ67_EUCGL